MARNGNGNHRRGSQRDRLIAGLIAAVRRHGYEGANVSQVIAAAGVSRPTFYEYFPDKESCFLCAHAELSELLVGEIERAIAAEPPARALQATVRRLVELAEAHPDRAALLVNETMAGGAAPLDAHDRLIERMAALVEAARARVPARVRCPDMPVQTALGAGRWLLAPALRRGQHDLSGLARELVGWIERYNRPRGEHRWCTFEPGPELAPSPYVTPLPLVRRPAPRRGGRRGGAGSKKREAPDDQRARILYATAEVTASKGYSSATVADIAAAAGVDRSSFYRHFRDKQHAFLAVHEIGIQHAMSVAAGAFFSAGAWPDRVWEGTRAGVQFEAANPVITRIGYIDSHAVGAPAIQRIEDTRAAFTIFLQEGNGLAREPLSRTAMEAIAGAVFEVGYQQVRAGPSELVTRQVPNSVYLVLAPFLGPKRASELIDAKLAEAGG